jgi:putative transposase
MLHARPRRLPAFDYAGFHRYHVRVGTWNRVPHFANPACVATSRDQLLGLAQEHELAVNAYCFMPHHVHVLLAGRSPAARVGTLIAAWKQRTGYAFARSNPGTRLWQPSYFERVLRENEGNEVVARYILENPVRAGLAARIGEYPHAWCTWPIEDLVG